MKVFTPPAFKALITEIRGEPIEDLHVTIADCGLDSFHLMELVAQLDDHGVELDEDAMLRVTTLQELYDECIRASARAIS